MSFKYISFILLFIIFTKFVNSTTCSGKVDYCGVCNGDGSTCCTKSYCDDHDLCTVDSCPPPYTPVDPAFPLDTYCEHVTIPDPWAGNKCIKGVCNPLDGKYTPNYTKCPELNEEGWRLVGCDPAVGCQYEEPKGCGICELPKPCNSTACIKKTSMDCAKELDGHKIDKCKIYSCDPVKGCVKEDKCKQGPNPCLAPVCDCFTGMCGVKRVKNDKCKCGCVDDDKLVLGGIQISLGLKV
ncbi:hypothetical protein DICPUDRAFT_91543 [Dictyostelium purpureum]|uniref:Uncharacterized protein n=1 Tax=Dictyostelium purpureum TaxID=5786 RepID=F0ZE01_DICPU|nr:uncharacterized protein DICPUDRAFT_91543 [Dictyostelium purpureum]EGC37829.1 hypothetical protein DICPUDRAFT_91543 [Dictyostelium purpureum]|eukprot:XP_003285674.1 hypothetical protein DICPUDRAFT_91543 [Dictyostelium purpureum]